MEDILNVKKMAAALFSSFGDKRNSLHVAKNEILHGGKICGKLNRI